MSVNKRCLRIREGFIKTGEDFTQKFFFFQNSPMGARAPIGPKLAPPVFVGVDFEAILEMVRSLSLISLI